MGWDKERYATDPAYRERILARNARWAKKQREENGDEVRAKERARASRSATPAAQPSSQPAKLGRILGLQCGWAMQSVSGIPRVRWGKK